MECQQSRCKIQRILFALLQQNTNQFMFVYLNMIFCTRYNRFTHTQKTHTWHLNWRWGKRGRFARWNAAIHRSIWLNVTEVKFKLSQLHSLLPFKLNYAFNFIESQSSIKNSFISWVFPLGPQLSPSSCNIWRFFSIAWRISHWNRQRHWAASSGSDACVCVCVAVGANELNMKCAEWIINYGPVLFDTTCLLNKRNFCN